MIKYPGHISGIVLLLAACTASSSGPGSRPAVSSPIPSELPTSSDILKKGSWILSPDSEAQSYLSVFTTIIYQTDSPNIRRDSLTTKIKFTISQTRISDAILWTGIITDFTTEPFSSADFGIQSSHFPLFFTGSSKNHQLQFDLKNQAEQNTLTGCNFSRLPLAAIQKISFVLPLHLTTGETWQDSTNSTVCAGSIPSTTTVVRAYQVLGTMTFQGQEILTVNENERALSKGEGSQGQHRITIEGSTTTTRQLNVDTISGNLISSKAITTTLLTVQISGETKNFTQLTTDITTRSH